MAEIKLRDWLGSSCKSTYFKELHGALEAGQVNLKHSIQRPECWDNETKSMFVYSALIGACIPRLYGVQYLGNPMLYIIDGKQRCSAIRGFINGDFALDLPEDYDYIDIINANGEVESLSIDGMYYSDLPEKFREKFNGCQIAIEYYEGLRSDYEVGRLFELLNRGKELSTFDVAWANMTSSEVVSRIGEHRLFERFSENDKKHRRQGEVVAQTFAVLNNESVSLGKDFYKTMRKIKISSECEHEIVALHDYLSDVVNIIDKQRGGKKITKKMNKKTHIVSMMPIVKIAVRDEVEKGFFADWAKFFFDGVRSATNNEEYNQAAKQRSASAENVRKRIDIIKNSFTDYIEDVDRGLPGDENARTDGETTSYEAMPSENENVSASGVFDISSITNCTKSCVDQLVDHKLFKRFSDDDLKRNAQYKVIVETFAVLNGDMLPLDSDELKKVAGDMQIVRTNDPSCEEPKPTVTEMYTLYNKVWEIGQYASDYKECGDSIDTFLFTDRVSWLIPIIRDAFVQGVTMETFSKWLIDALGKVDSGVIDLNTMEMLTDMFWDRFGVPTEGSIEAA